MNQNFPGQTAVYIFYPYSKEHSCKKAKKSHARFSGKICDRRTTQPTDQPTIRGLTSTVVENCNVLKDLLNVSDLLRPQWPPSISLIWWIDRVHLLFVSKHAISSQSGAPKSRKWPNTLFLAIWIIQKAFLWFLNDPAWVVWRRNRARHLVLTKYANIKSIWCR